MNPKTTRVVVVVIATLVCVAPHARQRQPDCVANVLIEWNDTLLRIGAAEDGLLTLKTVRAAAMMHIAMHDALNSIHAHYRPYAFHEPTGPTDPIAAASQAAYVVVSSQYPQHEAQLQQLLNKALIGTKDRDARRRAIDLGGRAAGTILERRTNDGWDHTAPYRWRTPAPGVYADFSEHSGTPPGFVFGTGWAHAQPFVLRNPHQFRAPPPPSTASDAYTSAFNEVKSLGGFASSVRTRDQTHIAFWWKDFAESSHNRLARQLVAQRGTDLWTAARMFALLNIAIFDGYVSSFDSKFAHNHWRPYTAIRGADHDGNLHTQADPQWTTTHRHTYPFPSYPSAHGTVCAAGMTVLADTFGDTTAFTMETREVTEGGPQSPLMKPDPTTRSFASFSAAARECAESRIFLGIHFRYDAIEGNELGRKVGKHAIKHHLVAE